MVVNLKNIVGFMPKTGIITKPVNFCGLINKDILSNSLGSDELVLSTRKLSKEDLNAWRDTVEETFRNNCKGLKTTKNMNDTELDNLMTQLRKTNDVESFLLMSTGGRPAIGTFVSRDMMKLKSPDYDILVYSHIGNNNAGFIFNKKAMLENIDSNKDFYAKRLRVPPNTESKDIYKTLVSPGLSPLYNVREYQDIIGLMFGFPRKNTVIFQLEADSNFDYKLRENVPKYKAEMKKVLFSPDSRYKDFDDEFKQSISDSINSITTIDCSRKFGYPDGYTFVKYSDEPNEEGRIGRNIRESTKELKRLNNLERERRFARDLDALENSLDSGFQFNNCLSDLIDKYGMYNK